MQSTLSPSHFCSFRVALILIFNICFLPVYMLFAILAFIITLLPNFPTRVARRNLRMRCGFGYLRATWLIWRLYMNYSFYFVEAVILIPLGLHKTFFVGKIPISEFFSNKQKKDQQTTPEGRSGRGFVVLLPHLANVEMYHTPLREADKKIGKSREIYAIAKPARLKMINFLLDFYRQRMGLEIIWKGPGFAHAFNRITNNREHTGTVICLLADQKPESRGGGVFIKFFGEYAAFPLSGLRLCMSRDMIVVYATGKRIFPGILVMHYFPGKNPHLSSVMSEVSSYLSHSLPKPAEIFGAKEEIRARDIYAAEEMSYFVAWLEGEVRRNMSQWCWDYNKWSRQPNSRKMSSF